MRKSLYLYLLCFIFYALTAALSLHRVLLNPGYLPGAAYGNKFQTDYYHFHWNYWWIRHALTHGLPVYETDYVMFPHTVNLAYHSFTPIYFPLWALFEPLVGTIAAVNIIIILSMTLMGWTLFLLAREYRVPIGFALMGGLVFQLLPTHWNALYLTNLNYLSMFWLPIQLLLWKKLADTDHPRQQLAWGTGLGLSFYATLLSDPQIMVYSAPMLISFGFWRLIQASTWPKRLWLVMAGLLAMAIMLVLAWFAGPLRYLLDFDNETAAKEPAEGAFKIPFPDGFYQRLPEYWLTRSELSLGALVLPVTVLSLIAGLWLLSRKKPTDSRWLWLLTGLFPLILSAGAMITLAGHDIPLPYGTLHDGLGGVFRQPARFAEGFTVGAMIFCGLVWGTLLKKRMRQGLTLVLFVVILAEANVFTSIPIQKPPQPYKFYAQMGRETGPPYDDYVVLEVPTGSWSGEWGVGTQDFVTLQYHALTHHKRVVNGFVARVPPWNFLYMETADPVMAWLGQRRFLEPDLVEPQLRQMIFDWPVGYIVVHQDMIGLNSVATVEIIGYFNALPDLLCPYAVEGDAIAYRTAWHPSGCQARTPPQIEAGVYQLDIGQGDEAFLGWGFHPAEQIFDGVFRWTGAYPQTTLYLDLPPAEYEMVFNAQAFVEERIVTIWINDTHIGDVIITPQHLVDYRVNIPAEVIGDGHHITLRFEYDGWIVPSEAGINPDPRRLAILLDWVKFIAQS